MENKISTINRNKEIDYSQEVLPKSWVWSPSAQILDGDNYLKYLTQFIDETREALCIVSEEIDDERLCKAIFSISERVRVYILVGKYSDTLKALTGHCLIRVAPVARGTLIIRDKEAGIFLSGSLSQEKVFACQSIDSPQIEDLFHYFCYIFWERTTEEYITTGGFPTPITSKGVDIYFDGKKATREYLYDNLLEEGSGRILSSFVERYISLETGDKPFFIQKHNKVSMEAITFSSLPDRVTFEAAEPKFPQSNLQCLMIDYHWTVQPITLPPESCQANLYEEWAEVAECKRSEIEQLKKNVESLPEHQKRSLSEDERRLYLSAHTDWSDEVDKLIELLDSTQWGKDRASHQKAKEIEAKIRLYSKDMDRLHFNLDQVRIRQQLDEKRQEMHTIEEEINMLEENDREMRKSLTKNKESIDAECKGLEKKLKRSFEDNKSSSLSVLYGPGQQQQGLQSIRVSPIDPNLALLPGAGILYEKGENYYLVISSWNEYEEAQKEAIRLEATLCTNSITNE